MTINTVLSLILLPLALAIGVLTLQRSKHRIGRETLPALLFALTLLCWGGRFGDSSSLHARCRTLWVVYWRRLFRFCLGSTWSQNVDSK